MRSWYCNKSLQRWGKWVTTVRLTRLQFPQFGDTFFWLQRPNQMIVEEKLWLRLFKLQFCWQWIAQIDVFANNLWNKLCWNWGEAWPINKRLIILGQSRRLKHAWRCYEMIQTIYIPTCRWLSIHSSCWSKWRWQHHRNDSSGNWITSRGQSRQQNCGLFGHHGILDCLGD